MQSLKETGAAAIFSEGITTYNDVTMWHLNIVIHSVDFVVVFNYHPVKKLHSFAYLCQKLMFVT